MTPWSIIGGLLAGAVEVSICYRVLTGTIKQNFASWILWAALDGITAATIVCQKGNFLLAVVYSIGSAATAFAIYKRRSIEWTWFETMATTLVVGCMLVWKISGAWLATIAGTAAVMTAGMPQIVDAYRNPTKSPLANWILFAIANMFSVFGGKEWSVEERLYPACCTLYCILIALVTIRCQDLQKKTEYTEKERSP